MLLQCAKSLLDSSPEEGYRARLCHDQEIIYMQDDNAAEIPRCSNAVLIEKVFVMIGRTKMQCLYQVAEKSYLEHQRSIDQAVHGLE